MPATFDLKTPRPLSNEREYDAAVAEIDRLLDKDPAENTPASRRLEFLSILVEAYDDKHHELPARSTPQSVVLFMLDQQGKSRADLTPLLGSKGRVSEFLNGKRRLSMSQVSALRRELAIPADLIIGHGGRTVPEHRYAPLRPRPSKVREDSPRYEFGKPHAGGDERALLNELLWRVDTLAKKVDANMKMMAALLAELRRKR